MFIASFVCFHLFRPGTQFNEDSTVELNCSGAYPTVCIELSLDGLAVNAVLQVTGLIRRSSLV